MNWTTEEGWAIRSKNNETLIIIIIKIAQFNLKMQRYSGRYKWELGA